MRTGLEFETALEPHSVQGETLKQPMRPEVQDTASEIIRGFRPWLHLPKTYWVSSKGFICLASRFALGLICLRRPIAAKGSGSTKTGAARRCLDILGSLVLQALQQ